MTREKSQMARSWRSGLKAIEASQRATAKVLGAAEPTIS
jgi:hypothetical protein